MTKTFLILATILLLRSAAAAELQYDSLGSPTPRPNQGVSPNATGPNVPIPADKAAPSTVTTGKAATDGSQSTIGAPSDGGGNGPANSGITTPTDNGATPNGLTPE